MQKRSSNKETTVEPQPAVSANARTGHEPSQEDKNPAAVALGRLGGIKGGPARAKRLTAEQRKEIARRAALARWRKKK